jgi:hypothetical protein
VLELGSGIGLAGLCAAAMGCHVLLTDVGPVVDLLWTNIAASSKSINGAKTLEGSKALPSCVEEGAGPSNYHWSSINIAPLHMREDLHNTSYGTRPVPTREEDAASAARGDASAAAMAAEGALPQIRNNWECQGEDVHLVGNEGRIDPHCNACGSPGQPRTGKGAGVLVKPALDSEQSLPKQCCSSEEERHTRNGWVGAARVGGGSAAARELDWETNLVRQANLGQNDPRSAQFIIASEVIWLADLVEPFVQTLAELLAMPHKPECFMTYTHRGKEGSKTFAHAEGVLECMHAHKCTVHRLEEFQTRTNDGETVEMWHVVVMPG